MITVLLLSFVLLLALGVPVMFCMGLASVIALLWQHDLPLLLVEQRMFVMLDSFPLMAVPFFILAGELMSKGGIAQRLVNFGNTIVGHFRGGLGHVVILSNMILAGVSGSGLADIAAVGSLTIPAMAKEGYPRGYIACLQASAGTLGPIIPPSILMIIYANITSLSVARLFLAGFIPGVILTVGMMLIHYWWARGHGYSQKRQRPSLVEVSRAVRDSILVILMPAIIVGGIVFGIFTPTEAGLAAVVYGFVVSYFVYHEIEVRDLRPLLVDAAVTTSVVMCILAVASVFGWLIAYEELPAYAIGLLSSLTSNSHLMMFIIIVFLLFVGTLIDSTAALIILVPVLYPLGTLMKYDQVQFALVLIITFLVGAVTPPVAMYLFLASGMAKASLAECAKYLAPWLAVLLAVTFLVAYVPEVSLFLPRLFMK